jgi:hypothetical protein
VVEDDDEDDAPRKPKKKKKTAKLLEEDGQNAFAEWAPSLGILLVGLILSVMGTIGVSKHEDSFMSPGLAVAFMLVTQVISIPLTIAGLMIVGSLFGIEYGTFMGAVRNLAAMSFLTTGMMATFDWMRIPSFVYQPIIFMVGVGLFLALFRLDVWETFITMFMLNVLSWVFYIAMFFVLIAVLVTGSKMGGGGSDIDDGDDPPGLVGDDMDDDDPPPMFQGQGKGKGKQQGQGNGNGSGRRNRPFNPDPDDDN